MHQGRHLENLNPQQLDAVNHFKGPVLVLAGAGTGKTRILTRRIAHLVLEHRVRPSSILAVTFTNKACGEMRERLELILGNISNAIWISTFHSAGLRILRRSADLLGYGKDFNVYDASDSKEVIKRLIKERNIDEKRFPVQSFTGFIDSQKNIPKFPQDLSARGADFGTALRCEIYDLYQRALREANAFDFGDLLAQTHRLFTEHPAVLARYQEQLDFILVDEFQDTNTVQYELVRMLSGAKRNLLVVGDDDQSIYAFRGATVQNILDFEKDFPETKVVKLEQNYRSAGNILDGAHSVIVKNRDRKDKKLWTAADAGEAISLFCGNGEDEEASFVANEIESRVDGGLTYGDVAVFYRTNAQSRAIEEALLNRRIPYKVYGGLKFYDRKEIKDIVAYLRLISNRSDNQAFLRVINNPTRGIGAQTVQLISETAAREGINYFEAAARTDNKNVRKFVSLIERLKESYRSRSLFDLVTDVIEKTEYGPRLRAMNADPQALSRVENLQELKAVALTIEVASDADPLQEFLDRIALTAGADAPSSEGTEGENTAQDAVSLMTLHLAKGLEFDLVFFTGFEEGLVPHYKCMFEPKEVEEERRLCYVGMTRARHSLFVTRARRRGMFSAGGETSRFREPSRFAFDIPKGVCKDIDESFFITAVAEDFEGALEDDDLSSGLPIRRVRKDLPFARPGAPAWNLVKPAEELYRETDLGHLPILPSEAATEGRPVAHPSFGKGIIQRIEGDSGDSKGSFKVVVKFESFSEPKKLVFKFAGLRQAAN